MKRNVNSLRKMVWPIFILLFLFAQPAFGDETIDLVPGLNVVNYPVQVPPAYTSYDLLNDLRASGDVVSIQRYNRTSGRFQTTTWDTDNLQPTGVNFPINNEEGYFIYSEEALSLTFTGNRNCVSVNLNAGYNLVGFPCADGLSAHALLADLGETNVQDIKRYDPDSGEMQTAFWNTGVVGGENFSIMHGEGYQVTMLNDTVYAIPTPDPPGNLVGYPGDNKVALAWQPPPGWGSPGDLMLMGYNVYRSTTSGGPYTKLNADPLSHPSYSDESAFNATTYFYVVTALGVRNDESGTSNEEETTPFTTGPTLIGGTIQQPDIEWKLAESPYIINAHATFLSYSTLTIEPGVEVRVDGNYSINFYGNVQTLGTFANPIVFTSNKTTPARGDWAGINIVEDGVSSVFKYCHVEYAQVGFDIAFGAPTISHCIIRHSNDRGINLVSTVDGLIEYTTFENNRNYGIVVNFESDVTIQFNTVSGSQWGIYVARSAPLIMGNTLQSNSRNGIFVDLRGNPEILSNLVTANSSYGVYVQGNNTFQNNPQPTINAFGGTTSSDRQW
jgi:parallel beta-helix repeat protein